MTLTEKFDPVRIGPDGRMLCVYCGANACHKDLTGYGQIIRVNFRCTACNRSSQLRLFRVDAATFAGWFGASQPHRQISDWGGPAGFPTGHRK